MATKKITYGQLKAVAIAAQQVDIAWQRGAHELSRSCESSTDGITPEILKGMLLRGEYELYCVVEILPNGGQEPRGWFVAGITKYPLFNALLIYAAVGPGCVTEEIIKQAKDIATKYGCTQIQCASNIDKLIARYEELGMAKKTTVLRMEVNNG